MNRSCNVKCYGRGDVHEKIVKELDISQCEGQGVPCVLFVYKVSREIEDLQYALQWVTETQEVRQEDICAVVLLEKSLAKEGKPVAVAHQGMFDDKTVVVRILWKEKNSASKIREGPMSNSDAMRKIKESIKMQCYGRGEIHEKIVKELDISHWEEPGVPCILFVYKVSQEIQDIQKAFL